MSTNRFPTTCTRCRRRVGAGQASFAGRQGGRCTYRCIGSCDGSLPLPAPARSVPIAPVPTWDAYLYERVATLVREAYDDVDLAWSRYVEENEHFDGEVEIMASAKVGFYRRASEYLNHPDIREARAFAAREAEDEAAVYMAGCV